MGSPEYHREYNNKRYHRVMGDIYEYLGGRCVGCGAFKPLEIHHKNPEDKLFNVAVKCLSMPWEKLLKEIKKCELRCQDCHKEEHAAEHGLGMYTHHRCRCDICRNAWNEYHKNYKKGLTKQKSSVYFPMNKRTSIRTTRTAEGGCRGCA